MAVAVRTRSGSPGRRTARRGSPEAAIQTAIVRYLRVMLPAGFLVTSVANKPRSAVAGALEKRMGATRGWPDVAVYGRASDDRPFAGFIECKAPGGRVRPEQQDILDRLQDCGHSVGVARSIEDARALVAEWGLPSREAAHG